MLGSDRMRSRLTELRMAFDYVLIDAPPLNACNDAVILGALSDGVVLTLKANSSRRETAKKAVQELAAANVRTLGAVLNQRHLSGPAGALQTSVAAGLPRASHATAPEAPIRKEIRSHFSVRSPLNFAKSALAPRSRAYPMSNIRRQILLNAFKLFDMNHHGDRFCCGHCTHSCAKAIPFPSRNSSRCG